EVLKASYAALDDSCQKRMSQDGVQSGAGSIEYYAEMSYVGQAHQLEVQIPRPITEATLVEAVASFHAAHEQTYGHADTSSEVAFVTLRSVHRLDPEVQATDSHLDQSGQGQPSVSYREAWFRADSGPE